MPDETARVMLGTALDRLRAEMVSKAAVADLQDDSPLRVLILKTLDALAEQLDRDPEGLERALLDLQSTLGPRHGIVTAAPHD